MDAINNPEDSSSGTRKVPFSKTLYIEEDDFREDSPKQCYRLAPGREVRLRYAYLITYTEVMKDESGRIVELRCSYDPATRGGHTPYGRKVKSTIHWVGQRRLYQQRFVSTTISFLKNPNNVDEGHDFTENLNPDSLQVLHDCKIEPSLRHAEPGAKYQFERLGYSCVDGDPARNWCSIGPSASRCVGQDRSKIRPRKGTKHKIRRPDLITMWFLPFMAMRGLHL